MNTTNIETIKNVIDQSVDANSIENNASISILLSKLEKKDRLACESFLQDLSKEEIKEKLGISYASRNMRIYRLRGKINE
jgi:FixJ family two-component response regulator